ncbi:S8 family serine peptidase [Streptococcus suis]
MNLKNYTLLKNSLFIILLMLVLGGCSPQSKLTTVNYTKKEIGTEKSIGLYNHLKSDNSQKIAILDVAPSDESLQNINNLFENNYPISKVTSHADYIVSLIKKYIPTNFEIDMYCIGIDSIDVTALENALTQISNKNYLAINMSFILPESQPQIVKLLEKINANNTLIVGAAGNHSFSYSEFPANLPFIFSVGGIDKSGNLWPYSNFKNIDFVMPVNMPSDINTKLEDQEKVEGTSISAAYMTAYLCQLLTIKKELLNNPTNIIFKEVVKNSCNNDINKLMGYGQPILGRDER